MLVLAIVNAAVALLVNPWRDDRPSERFPGIVQDVAVIAIFMVIATVLLREQLLTTSAVGAVVVGFALQDTLGNLFAGLAIQIEKPFRVGHWIQVGGREGQVQEITWRATKLRTKDGEFLIVPNSMISKEPVLNYSEPTIPTRRASRSAPATDAAERGEARDPRGDGQLAAGDARAGAESAGQGLRRFGDRLHRIVLGRATTRWNARRATRCGPTSGTSSAAATSRFHIRFKSSTTYRRAAANGSARAGCGRPLAAVDLFAPLSEEARHALALSGDEHLFAAGETIVRQGAAANRCSWSSAAGCG